MSLDTRPANREIVRAYGETIRARTREFVQCEVADIRVNRRRGAAEVSIRFTVAPDGTVTEAKPITNFGGTPGLPRCLVANLRRIRFPPPGENAVFVTYPFRFHRTPIGPARDSRRAAIAKRPAAKPVRRSPAPKSASGGKRGRRQPASVAAAPATTRKPVPTARPRARIPARKPTPSR